MFTGLIEEKGSIRKVVPSNGGLRLTVEAPSVSGGVAIGDSVSVNGICLTAVAIAPPLLEFDAVHETVERGTLGNLRPGDGVNLERALRLGDRLGGHMVQGHVDGVGVLREIRRIGGEMLLRFEAPPAIMELVVEKGSVAIDGISLTVADTGAGWFSVAVIPHTLSATTLGEKSPGSAVNLETDIIGKYVFKYVGKTARSSDQSLLEKLAAGGFMD